MVSVKNGTLFLSNVQYHVAKVAANTISPSAEMKKSPQITPTMLYAYANENVDEFHQFRLTVHRLADKIGGNLRLYLVVGHFTRTGNFLEVACGHTALER